MPFCPKCGTEYQDGTKFCGKCGENVDGSAASAIPASAPADASATAIPAGTPAAAPAKPVKQGPGFFEKILNTKDHTNEMSADDIKQYKVMAILGFCGVFAYILFNWIGLGLVGLVAFAGLMVAPCLAYKKSEFVRFQMSQLYVAFFGVLLFSILDGAISGFFYSLIAPSAAEMEVLNSLGGFLGGASVAGLQVRAVIGSIVAWLLHIIFMAVPIFTLVIGFINVIKEKAKDMPFIGKIKVTFEK